MIVKIVQTASNIKQTYSIESEKFSLQGKTGSVRTTQQISLNGENLTIRGYFRRSKWVNYIPFRYLIGGENVTRTFDLFRGEKRYGSISSITHGVFEQFYAITLNCGESFRCYSCSKGSYNYVSVYSGDTQIALVETYLTVTDYRYVHTLYILDEYTEYADTLSFFVLYYANYTFAERLHMSKGTVYQKAWSFSRYNHKYDPTWKESHFPKKSLLERLADGEGEYR